MGLGGGGLRAGVGPCWWVRVGGCVGTCSGGGWWWCGGRVGGWYGSEVVVGRFGFDCKGVGSLGGVVWCLETHIFCYCRLNGFEAY